MTSTIADLDRAREANDHVRRADGCCAACRTSRYEADEDVGKMHSADEVLAHADDPGHTRMMGVTWAFLVPDRDCALGFVEGLSWQRLCLAARLPPGTPGGDGGVEDVVGPRFSAGVEFVR